MKLKLNARQTQGLMILGMLEIPLILLLIILSPVLVIQEIIRWNLILMERIGMTKPKFP